MPISASLAGAWRTVFGFVVGLCLTLVAVQPASAAVLYDFSLEQNGSVGAIHVVARFEDFLPPLVLRVVSLTDPSAIEATSGTPVDPDLSVVGFDVRLATTLVGLAFFQPGGDDFVLLNRDHPEDFFVFDRTPRQTGTFLSTAGLVESPLGLDTDSPIATLVVTQVPEPATVSLLGLATLGAIARRRRQRLG